MDNLSILETALAIRPHLPQRLNPPESAQTQQQLDHLLRQLQAGAAVEDEIWDLLTAAKATQTWSTEFQQTRASQKALSPLPGDSSGVSYHQFKCPLCDYIWSRDRGGRPTPLCPTHGVPLELVL